jgi:hypothetical protein
MHTYTASKDRTKERVAPDSGAVATSSPDFSPDIPEQFRGVHGFSTFSA